MNRKFAVGICVNGRESPVAWMTSTQFSPESGSTDTHDADEIPGMAWIRSSNWAYATATLSGSPYRPAGIETSIATTPSGENPRSLRSSLEKLIVNRAVTASSVTASAICTVSSTDLVRRPAPPIVVPPPARRMSCTSRPAMRHAGTMATASPAKTATNAEKASTRKSSRDVADARQIDGRGRHEHAQRERRNGDAERTADGGKHQLLQDDAPDKPPSACTQRRADGCVAQPRERPGQ